MQFITEEIERAIDSQLYYLAVTGSLALPDICAALESEDGKTTRHKYQAWYGLWLASKYPEMRGDDVYSLRSGVFHQGRFGHKGMRYAKVIFSLPGPTRAHRNVILTGTGFQFLNLDVVTFCRDVIASVQEWYASKEADPFVKANMSRLVRPHTDGLRPVLKNITVIA